MASPRGRRPGRSHWPQRLLSSLLIVVIVAGGTAAVGAYHLIGRLDVEQVDLGDSLDGTPPTKIENFLVVGSDSRAGADPNSPDYGSMGDEGDVSGRRSDTIMVLRIDPSTDRVALLSLPRDLWVPIAGTGKKQRINTAYSKGEKVLVDTVRQAFGIEINHFVEVDFQGFKRIVDAMGGVGVWFDHPSRDKNTGLVVTEPGCVQLGGIAALQYARSRHLQYQDGGKWKTDGTGDLGRISRQQDLVRRMLRKGVSAAAGSPTALANLLDAGLDSIRVDAALSRRDLVGLAKHFIGFDPAAMETYSIPANPKTISGNAVLVMDDAAAGPVLDVFRGVAPAPTTTAAPAPEPPAATAAPAPAPTAAPEATAAPATTKAPIGVVGQGPATCL